MTLCSDWNRTRNKKPRYSIKSHILDLRSKGIITSKNIRFDQNWGVIFKKSPLLIFSSDPGWSIADISINYLFFSKKKRFEQTNIPPVHFNIIVVVVPVLPFWNICCNPDLCVGGGSLTESEGPDAFSSLTVKGEKSTKKCGLLPNLPWPPNK